MPLTAKIERTPEERAWRKKRAVLMVCGCTVFGAAAQILMKMGAAAQPHGGMLALAIAIFTSATLFAGYSLYGLSTLMLIVALKDGQLSILYPVIALTYVWVTVLSVLIFNESVNVLKLAGLCAVVIGVAILGRSGHK